MEKYEGSISGYPEKGTFVDDESSWWESPSMLCMDHQPVTVCISCDVKLKTSVSNSMTMQQWSYYLYLCGNNILLEIRQFNISLPTFVF